MKPRSDGGQHRTETTTIRDTSTRQPTWNRITELDYSSSLLLSWTTPTTLLIHTHQVHEYCQEPCTICNTFVNNNDNKSYRDGYKSGPLDPGLQSLRKQDTDSIDNVWKRQSKETDQSVRNQEQGRVLRVYMNTTLTSGII